MFSGAALHVDPFLGSTVQNGAGTDPTGDSIIGAYFLNTDYIKLAFDSAAQFEMDDFEHVQVMLLVLQISTLVCRYTSPIWLLKAFT
jgi:hypothetical protein